MTSFKQMSCKLCLGAVKDTDFKVINDHTRIILDILLLHLNLDEKSEQVMCNACSKMLNAALEFKSMCMYTDNTIIRYIDGEKRLHLDLKQIYVLENEIVHNWNDQKVCRLCMQLITNKPRRIHKKELEAIRKIAPEMNITIIKDPVICIPCFDSLRIHNRFLKNCLGVKKRIISNNSDMKTHTKTSSDLYVKNDNLVNEFKIDPTEMSVKTECLEIKSETAEEDSDKLPSNFNEEPLNSGQYENKPERKHVEKQYYKCLMCDYQSKYKQKIRKHLLKHKSPVVTQMYKCDLCDFRSKYKSSLRRHNLLHKYRSDVQRCNNRGLLYKDTKNTTNVILHVRQKTNSQLKLMKEEIYGYPMCEYKDKDRTNVENEDTMFPSHELGHGHSAEVKEDTSDDKKVQNYSCDECEYRGKYNTSVLVHKIIKHNALTN